MNKPRPIQHVFAFIMRITLIQFLLMVIVTSLVSATSMKGQGILDRKVSLDVEDKELRGVLSDMERQASVVFTYSPKMIKVSRKISLTIADARLEEVLARIFSPEIAFLAIDEREAIVLRPATSAAAHGTLAGSGSAIPAIEVSGRVTDGSGQTLPGVNVLEKGTTNGTTTDADGRYSLSVQDENAVLVFSFIGYVTREVALNGRSIIDMVMEEEITNLDEVVVIGYGTQKKSDLTGAVSSVDVAQYSEMSNVSVLQSLQGNVAGLNVGAINQAGADPTISIRGQNTLSSQPADNAPLIVVDGIIFRGNIVDLNTADIASIDILKDGSSTAIYGSQASNGVVLITTKKGVKNRPPSFNFTTSYAIQKPSSELVPMDGKELEAFLKDVFWESGSRIGPDYLEENPNFSIVPFLRTSQMGENYLAGIEHNWWDLLTRDGSIFNQNLSVSGGSENINYFMSVGMTDVKGFMINEDYRKYNYRINLDTRINDWVSLGAETFLTSSDYSGVSPELGESFTMYPWAPIYDANGEYVLTPDNQGLNPFLEIQQDDNDKRLNLMGTLHADVKLPFLKGFNYRVNYSQNYITRNQDRFNPWGANFTGSAFKNTSTDYNWTLDHIFSYQRSFSERSAINLTFLYGVEERNFSYTNASAQDFVNKTLGYNRLQAGNPALNSLQSGRERENSLYTMARVFYSLDSKYLLTATIRRDGFSGFGSQRKIGMFPSVAVGWIVSEEDFFKGDDIVDFLKLRVSYGTSGRRAVGRYATQAIVSAKPSGAFGDGGASEMGQWISSLANDNLGWETTTGLNIGIDFGIKNSRFNGNLEYFNNNTKDILYDVQLPVLTGFSSVTTNIGKVHNWGVEMTLNANVIRQSDFSWKSSVVFSRVRNKIVSILGPNNDQDGDGREDDLVANGLFIGQPQNVNYNYEVVGIWQLADKEAGRIPAGFMPGTYKLADLNGDGVISASHDRKILGYRDPSYRLGWSNTFSYKNFSLFVFINTIQGGKKYYQANLSFGTNPWHKLDQLVYSNPPKGAWDYWMPENPNAKFRRPDNPSSLGLHAGPHGQRNFVRLQDVSLAYNFDRALVEKWHLTNLKLFVSGKNLMTITDWDGWDPETGQGLVLGRPVMTNYSLGLNIEF